MSAQPHAAASGIHVWRVDDLELHPQELLRRQAGSGRHLPAAAEALATELWAEARQLELLQPVVAWGCWRIVERGPDRVRLHTGEDLEGRMLVTALAGAERLALAMGTIGPRLEARVAHWQQAGDDLRAWLLDAIGNAGVDALAARTLTRIAEQSMAQGAQCSGALAPGLHGLPVRNQRVLARLLDSPAVGITLTAGDMMAPVKSFSLIAGLGDAMRTWDKAQACDWCALHDTCAFREPHGTAGGAGV